MNSGTQAGQQPGTPVAPVSGPPAGFSISPAQLTVLVVCVITVYFVISFYTKSLESFRISQRADVVQRELKELEATNKQLRQKVADLSAQAYVEMAARDKLNLSRPGDRSLLVLDDVEVAGVTSPPAGAEMARASIELGHLGEWLALFFAPG